MFLLPPQPLPHLYLLPSSSRPRHAPIHHSCIHSTNIFGAPTIYPRSSSRCRVTKMSMASSPSSCSQFRGGIKQIKQILSRKFYNHSLSFFFPQLEEFSCFGSIYCAYPYGLSNNLKHLKQNKYIVEKQRKYCESCK